MEALSEMSLTMRMLFSSLDEVSTMILRLAPWTARRKRKANCHNLPIMLLERLLIDTLIVRVCGNEWGRVPAVVDLIIWMEIFCFRGQIDQMK